MGKEEKPGGLDISVIYGGGGAEQLNEREMKAKIEKEVNELIYQKQSENIVAFKELWEKEQRNKQNTDKWKDQSGITSQHHMALEAAVRRIKAIMHKKKQKDNVKPVEIDENAAKMLGRSNTSKAIEEVGIQD
jgi:hypothetical protein